MVKATHSLMGRPQDNKIAYLYDRTIHKCWRIEKCSSKVMRSIVRFETFFFTSSGTQHTFTIVVFTVAIDFQLGQFQYIVLLHNYLE